MATERLGQLPSLQFASHHRPSAREIAARLGQHRSFRLAQRQYAEPVHSCAAGVGNGRSIEAAVVDDERVTALWATVMPG